MLRSVIRFPLRRCLRHAASSAVSTASPLGLLDASDLAELASHLPSQISLREGLDTSLIESIVSERFNLDLMTFAELPSKAETDELCGLMEEVSAFMHAAAGSAPPDAVVLLRDPDGSVGAESPAAAAAAAAAPATPPPRHVELTAATKRRAAELGLFGLCAPHDYGGLQLSPLALTSVLETIGGHSVPFAALIAMHNLWVTRAVSWYGTKAQKAEFLPSLVKGEVLGGTLLSPPHRYESSGGGGGGGGGRALVGPEPLATCENCFIAYGDTGVGLAVSLQGGGGGGGGAALLHRMDGAEAAAVQSELHYSGLSPPLRFGRVALLANPQAVSPLADAADAGLVDSDAFQFVAIASGALVAALNAALTHLSHETRFDAPMCSHTAVQSALGEVQTLAYVLQSLVYFISGLAHAANGRVDRSIESSLAVLYAPRLVRTAIGRLHEISPRELRERLERDLDDIRTMMLATAQAADQAYISEFVLVNVHKILFSSKAKNAVLKLRNKPRHRVMEVKRRRKLAERIGDMASVTNTRASAAWIKSSGQLPYRIYEAVHPSLEQAAMMLEYASYQLDTASKFMAVGSCPTQWFLESAFDVLCMAACISRSSRSYSIGVRNADDERIITQAFCHETAAIVRKRLNQCCYDDNDQVRILPKQPFDIHDGIQVPQHPYDMS